MWIFKLVTGESSRLFYLTPEKREIVIGRSNSALILENDSSISRKHCTLHIAKKENCPSAVRTKTGIWAIDTGSKYGTYVRLTEEFQKLNEKQPFILQHGCFIRFGIIENVWSVEYKPILILCNSSVSADLKTDLRTQMINIGGDIMPFCDHRTSYLVANSYSLTEKVLLALIHGIPLVTPSFIEQLLLSIKENKTFPDPRNFKPELKEIAVRLEEIVLEPGHKRQNLFTGLQFFVTCPNRLNNLKPIVEAAGGIITVFEEKYKPTLLDTGAIVLETFRPEDSQLSQATSDIKDYLERNGKRTIPDREIPLAIAYASAKRLCNANCTEFSVRSATPLPVICSQSTLIEENTQIPRKNFEGNCIIECTPLDHTEGLSEDRNDCSTQNKESRLADSAFTGSNIPNKHNLLLNKNVVNEMEEDHSELPQNTNRKRVGSLDIFGEQNPKKILLSQKPSSKISVPSSIFQSPVFESAKISAHDGERIQNSSQLSFSNSLSQSGNADNENPFGKRKIIEEPLQSSVKKSKPNTNIKQSNLHGNDENIIAPAAEPVFTVPLAPIRTQLAEKIPKTSPDVTSTPSKNTDCNGWIDMSHRKDVEKTPGDPLSTTIIMLSLVTVAQNYRPKPHETDCPRNVKVFKKQILPEFNRTVDLQSMPNFDDDFPV